jgi:cobalt-zinc-cadmium efflux system protein
MSGHNHSHQPPKGLDFAFAVSAFLNIALVLVEGGYALSAHSVALLADAGHNLGDVLGLLLAWGAVALSRRLPSTKYTYGFRSSSILAALINGGLLLVATGAIIVEAIRHFFAPSPVQGGVVIVVAAVAIGINAFSAWLLRGRKNDLNARGAFLHLVADAAVSLGVLIAGVVILATGWNWVDPIVSIGISLVIVWSAWGLLKEALNMALAAVPTSVNPDQVKKYLEDLAGVVRIHDLHIWPISTTEIALTCHLVIPSGHPSDDFMAKVAAELKERFGISHATLQDELGSKEDCALEPVEVV